MTMNTTHSHISQEDGTMMSVTRGSLTYFIDTSQIDFHPSGLNLGGIEVGTVHIRATLMKGHKWVDLDNCADNHAIKRGGMMVDDYLAKVLQEPGLEARVSSFRRRVGSTAIDEGNVSLAALRLSVGLTQQQLADRMGMRQPNVARLERNPRAIQIETMMKLSEALSVSLQAVVEAVAKSISARAAIAPTGEPNAQNGLDHVH